jgi:hypothetical protein
LGPTPWLAEAPFASTEIQGQLLWEHIRSVAPQPVVATDEVPLDQTVSHGSCLPTCSPQQKQSGQLRPDLQEHLKEAKVRLQLSQHSPPSPCWWQILSIKERQEDIK